MPSNYGEVETSYQGLKNEYKFKRSFGSLNENCFLLGSVLIFYYDFLCLKIIVFFYYVEKNLI